MLGISAVSEILSVAPDTLSKGHDIISQLNFQELGKSIPMVQAALVMVAGEVADSHILKQLTHMVQYTKRVRGALEAEAMLPMVTTGVEEEGTLTCMFEIRCQLAAGFLQMARTPQ